MPSSDIEANEYDLGTTSVRLVRVGNVVQALFSNPLEAKLFFSEVASKFKKAQAEFGGQ